MQHLDYIPCSKSFSVCDVCVKSWKCHTTWSLKDVKNGQLVEKNAWGRVGVSVVRHFVQEQCCEIKETFTKWKLSVAITPNQTVWSGLPSAEPDLSELQAAPLMGMRSRKGNPHCPENRAPAAKPDETLDLLSKRLALRQASPRFSLQTTPNQAAEVKRGAKREQAGERGESRADKQLRIFWLAPRVTWTDAYLLQRA